MGKIRSGILSRVSGKVAGVVGGNWKNVAYLREYVVPANPNTTAQAAQRTKFSACVEFAKLLVGPIFQTYTDKFQKNMSGYNAFIKANIAQFPTPTWENLKITEGPLFPPFDASLSNSGGNGRVSWSGSDLGPNGSASDKVYGFIYNPTDKACVFAAAPVLRSAGVLTFTGRELIDTDRVYVFASSYSGDILKSISNSVGIQYFS